MATENSHYGYYVSLNDEGDIMSPGDGGFDAVGFNNKYSEEVGPDTLANAAKQERQWRDAGLEVQADDPDYLETPLVMNLGKRATSLLDALTYFSEASKLQGLLESNDKKEIENHGGVNAIVDLVRENLLNGKRALREASAIDTLELDVQDANDRVTALSREFQTTYTAYGVRAMKRSGFTKKDKELKLKEIQATRKKFRTSLERQQFETNK